VRKSQPNKQDRDHSVEETPSIKKIVLRDDEGTKNHHLAKGFGDDYGAFYVINKSIFSRERQEMALSNAVTLDIRL
jgi:hypothetical protein